MYVQCTYLLSQSTAVEWIHHFLRIEFCILSILPWSMWVQNLQLCAKPSFSLLLILLGLLNEPADSTILARADEGEKLLFHHSRSFSVGSMASWPLDRVWCIMIFRSEPCLCRAVCPGSVWTGLRRGEGTQCGPEQRCPVARRESQAKTKLDFYLGSRQHLFTSHKNMNLS